MIHTARLNITCVQDLISDRLITENLQAETVSKMVLSISERTVNVCIASGKLTLRLLSKRISSRIYEALFLYIFNLPLDTQVPKDISEVILCVGILYRFGD